MHTRPRAEWRTALALGCAVSLFLLLFHRTSFSSSDEIGVYEITRSLAERGRLDVPPIRHSYLGRDGIRYSHFAVGQAVLALPFYGLGRLLAAVLPASAVRWLEGPGVRTVAIDRSYRAPEIFAVLLYPIWMTGLLTALFFAFERRLSASVPSALLASAMLATSSYAALHATFFLRHTTEAVLILSAFLLFFDWKEQGGAWRLLLGSGAASALLLVRVPAVVFGVGLLGYLGIALRARWRGGVPAREAARSAAAVGAPFVLALAAHLILNRLQWGTWLESPMVAQRRMFGAPSPAAALGLLASPGGGLLAYTPLLLLLPWMFPHFWRRQRAEAVALLAITAPAWLFVSAFEHWHGLWAAPGPRYLFVAVPLLLLPLGPWLDATPGRGARLAVAALAAAGAFFQAALMATHWTHLVQAMGYAQFEPAFGFLFAPGASPIVGALRAAASGELNDLWIVQMARGWPGQPGSPGAAAALFGAWLAGLLLCVRQVLRAVGARG